jgi:hypothetical protein
MASYFISARGTIRREGNRQTRAKFIVPAGVTIYFYSPSGTVLQAVYSDFIMDLLISPESTHGDELMVREAAYEVFREGELCLNYTAHTDGDPFRDPMGLYRVGKAEGRVPVIPLPNGTVRTLQQWVQGMGGGDGAFGTHFYRGACREHGVQHASPNTWVFLENQQRGGMFIRGSKPDSYTRRYGNSKAPFAAYDGGTFRQQRVRVIKSRNQTMASQVARDGRTQLQHLLARLEKGEGLFGPGQ